MEEFIKKFDKENNTYQGIKLDMKKQPSKEKLIADAKEIANECSLNLKDRFPLVEITHKFGVFDLDLIKNQKDDIVSYGNQTIGEIVDFFKEVLPPKNIIISEWVDFKISMKGLYQALDYENVYNLYYKLDQGHKPHNQPKITSGNL